MSSDRIPSSFERFVKSALSVRSLLLAQAELIALSAVFCYVETRGIDRAVGLVIALVSASLWAVLVLRHRDLVKEAVR